MWWFRVTAGATKLRGEEANSPSQEPFLSWTASHPGLTKFLESEHPDLGLHDVPKFFVGF